MREPDRVDPEIEQRPSAQGRVEGATGGIEVEDRTVVGGNQADVSQHAVGEQGRDHRGLGQEARPHGLHGENARGPRGIRNLPGLYRCEGNRFLDEHVLAGGNREERECPMLAVGSGDVDDIHAGIRHQALIAVVRALDTEARGEGGGTIEGTRPDRVHPLVGVCVECLNEIGGYSPGRKHSPAKSRPTPQRSCGRRGKVIHQVASLADRPTVTRILVAVSVAATRAPRTPATAPPGARPEARSRVHCTSTRAVTAPAPPRSSPRRVRLRRSSSTGETARGGCRSGAGSLGSRRPPTAPAGATRSADGRG